jgi:hypothetical protein
MKYKPRLILEAMRPKQPHLGPDEDSSLPGKIQRRSTLLAIVPCVTPKRLFSVVQLQLKQFTGVNWLSTSDLDVRYRSP